MPAILNVWFAGSEAGFAIGDVLFGDVNPTDYLYHTKNGKQMQEFIDKQRA